MIGQVEYFNFSNRKYGFVKGKERIYIPSQQIVDGFKFLRPNDIIEFEPVKLVDGRLRANLVKVIKPHLYSRKFSKGGIPPSDFELVFYDIAVNTENIGKDFTRYTVWLAGKRATTSVLISDDFEIKPINKKEFTMSHISWKQFMDNLYHACIVNPWWVEEVKAVGLEKLIGG